MTRRSGARLGTFPRGSTPRRSAPTARRQSPAVTCGSSRSGSNKNSRRKYPTSFRRTRPRGRILPLRKVCSIKEEILARPTFFEHFDGVLVDWRYLHDRRIESVREEAGWLGRQGLRVIVDLTSGINSYPDLRLTNNLAADYAASMTAIDDVLAKMTALGARDLVISSYQQQESNLTAEKFAAAIEATIREICRRAEGRRVTVYLRIYPGKPPLNLADALQTIKRIGAANLRLAPSTAQLLTGDMAPGLIAQARGKIGLWMVGQPAFDLQGRLWSVHKPIAEAEQRQPWLNSWPSRRMRQSSSTCSMRTTTPNTSMHPWWNGCCQGRSNGFWRPAKQWRTPLQLLLAMDRLAADGTSALNAAGGRRAVGR